MMTSTRWKLTQTSEFELEHALRNLDCFKNIFNSFILSDSYTDMASVLPWQFNLSNYSHLWLRTRYLDIKLTSRRRGRPFDSGWGVLEIEFTFTPFKVTIFIFKVDHRGHSQILWRLYWQPHPFLYRDVMIIIFLDIKYSKGVSLHENHNASSF